jgi:hypothetical protein
MSPHWGCCVSWTNGHVAPAGLQCVVFGSITDHIRGLVCFMFVPVPMLGFSQPITPYAHIHPHI